jgi:flavin-dependent dehydrogenase
LPGIALSREVFDAALIDKAIEAGVEFLPEAQAHLGPVLSSTRGVSLRQQGEEVLARGRVVLGADGLGGRLLAGEAGSRIVVQAGSRLGAGVIVDRYPAFFDTGTVYMACGSGGYAGLVRIEDGRLNIASALDGAFVKQAGGLGPAVATILQQAGFPAIDGLENLPWHGTPLLTRRAAPPAAERVLLLGDAASYVEPFSGEGMAWALAAGAGVVPFALKACRDWNPELVRKWSVHYRCTILRRQWICQGAAKILRQPKLVRLLVGTMTRFPLLAAPFVQYINHARFW